MNEHKVGGHTVEYYDAVDDLPIVRHHRFNEFIALKSGIGSTIQDVDEHITGLVQMINRGDKEMAINKALNMGQSLKFAIENVDPQSMAFAVLVHKIDGKEMNDTTDHGLNKVISLLSEIKISYSMIKTIVEYVKKKLKKKRKSISPKSSTEAVAENTTQI
jgi:hypothetical protein